MTSPYKAAVRLVRLIVGVLGMLVTLAGLIACALVGLLPILAAIDAGNPLVTRIFAVWTIGLFATVYVLCLTTTQDRRPPSEPPAGDHHAR